MTKRVIGIIGYDGVNGFDLAGPAEVFASATSASGGPIYAIEVLAAEGRPFGTEAGIRICPSATFSHAPQIDTLILPGGAGLREPAIGGPIVAWLRSNADRCRRIVSVCTGIYGLAQAGLLDGRHATTHWRFAADVKARYPAIRLDPDCIFVKDGSVYTSGGISAGIDLALALVEEDLGRPAALAIARDMVVFLKRSGGQQQYSEPLRFQTCSGDRFADLVSWLPTALAEDLSIETLASRAGLSARQFTRAFVQATGVPPGAFVERLRIDRAAHLLVDGTASVEAVACEVGYRSSDVFRRAFSRQFAVAPAEYRERFGMVEGAVFARA